MLPRVYLLIQSLTCLVLCLLGPGVEADQIRLGIQTHASDPSQPLTHPLSAPLPLQTAVTFDRYSLIVHGKRIFLWSGEFHSWRLPSTDLWLDVLQKIKAAGFNAISIYTHWGLVESSPGQLDFDDWRQLTLQLELAQKVGLYVVVRPGPYINAETTYGGLPGWVTQLPCDLRTNETAYFNAWQGYIKNVASQIEPYQATHGGPVILVQLDNEHYNSYGTQDYMLELRRVYRENGIVVPLTFNDGAMNGYFSKGRAAADIYGFDSYPQLFDCDRPSDWRPLPETYYEFHQRTNPNQPLYIPEYQGGAFDRWNGPGYEACAQLTGSSFERVFVTGGLLAANAKMINIYMAYGGTSWGHLAYPGVYTSYDYGAIIKEDRSLRQEKYGEMKLIGMFLASSPDFVKTDMIASGTNYTTSSTIFTAELQNPDTHARFYISRHKDSTSSVKTSFKQHIRTSIGSITVPVRGKLRLNGRDARILVTDFKLSQYLFPYCTASMAFAGKIGKQKVLVLHADLGDSFELVVNSHLAKTNDSIIIQPLDRNYSRISGNVLSDTQIISFPDLVIEIMDANRASTIWAPSVSNDERVLIEGPYLLRNASIQQNTLYLYGDIDRTTKISIIYPETVTRVMWNNQSLSTVVERAWFRTATLHFQTPQIHLPDLKHLVWRYHPSLPEIQADFNASGMQVASRSLFAGDYGFFGGTIIFRGTFSVTRRLQSAMFLKLAGGAGFGAALYLNGLQIGFVSSRTEVATLSARIPADLLWYENTIVLVMDTHGGQEASGPPREKEVQNPRGILRCTFEGPDVPIEWRVQGNLGGNTLFPDKLRGLYNEGGLWGERQRFHLPEYNDTHWREATPFEGIRRQQDVSFFRTSFELNLPSDYDTALSVVFDNSTTALYRAQLYVNGYQFGKRVPHVGPQTEFPIPKGIINHNGGNTLALSFWSYGNRAEDWRVASLSIKASKIAQGGV